MRRMKKSPNELDSASGPLPETNAGQGRGGTTGFILLVVFILIMVSISGVTLSEIHSLVRNDMRSTLGTVLNGTARSLDRWLDDQLSHAEIWASSPELRQRTGELLALNGDRERLLASPSLASARHLFLSSLHLHGFLEFFIVAPDGRVLAQLGQSHLGLPLPAEAAGDSLDRVFAGRSLHLLPQMSEILAEQSPQAEGAKRAGMFFAAPLKDPQGQVIAALLLYSDPETGLSSITGMGSIGRSGQTYAFDHQGRLVTTSRHGLPRRTGTAPGNGILTLQARAPSGSDPRRAAARGDSLPFTQMARMALAGRDGIDLDGYLDYRGVPVIGAWLWDKQAGCGLATEIERAEAYRSYYRTRRIVILVLLTTVIMFVGLSLVLHRSRKEALRLARQSTRAGKQLQREIEVRRQVEDSLRESDAYIRAVVDSVVDGIITTDENCFIETFNPAAERMFGYIAAEMRGQNLGVLFEQSLRRESDRESRRATRHEEHPEMLGRRKDGSNFPVEFEINEMCLGSRRMNVGIVRDITERKKYELELRRLSCHDGLTSIANRRHFNNILQKEWDRAVEDATPLALILLDIDHFKGFNDTYGHQAGDECLVRVAAVLRDQFQRPADLPARYGGEEFAVILPETGIAGAMLLAEKVRNSVERLQINHSASLRYKCVTVSLGVSCLVPSPEIEIGPGQLIAEADRALYLAKDSGRNRVVSALQARSEQEESLNTELTDGIAH